MLRSNITDLIAQVCYTGTIQLITWWSELSLSMIKRAGVDQNVSACDRSRSSSFHDIDSADFHK